MKKSYIAGAVFVVVVGFAVYWLLDTTINEEIMFAPLTTTYVTAQDWPPLETMISGEFSCNSGGSEITPNGETVERMINNNQYCVVKKSEGAAGSTYTTYTYTTASTKNANKLTQTVFTLRFSQCENYDDPERKSCKKEQSSFNPDRIVEPEITPTCYRYDQVATQSAPYSVSELIRMTRNGDEIIGTKEGTQMGPDMTNGYLGTLTGTISNDMLTVVFDYTIEGSSNKEQELYAITDIGLTKHRYPLMENNGMLVPDTTQTFTELVYRQETCEQ